MKHFGKIVSYLILAINAFFVGMLILTAYSPYLHPKIHPLASCLGLTFPIFLAINICFVIFWLIINYRYTVLTIVGLLVCYQQIQTYIPINFTDKSIPENSIKLLSYNVMGFNNLEKKDEKNPILSYLSESGRRYYLLTRIQRFRKSKVCDRKRYKESLKSIPILFHPPTWNG